LLSQAFVYCRFWGNAQGLEDGLVHHYQFDGNGNDRSTNLNHLTNFGATPTTNRHGDTSQAYHFTNGQYMSGPLSKLPVGNATRSTSIWLYLDIDPDSDVPFCWGTTNTSAGYGVAIGTNVGFTNGIRHFGWGNDIGFSYKYPVKEWFHLVTIYDGDTGKVYINAQLVSTEAKKWNTGSELFLVGKNLNANPRDGFEGAIDEFRVYDRVLTENQIVALWHSDNTSVANTHLSNARVYPNPTTGKLEKIE